MTNLLLVKNVQPNDPITSGDVRIWHLLDKGNADLIYCQTKKYNINQKLIEDRLSWKKELKVNLVLPISNLERGDFIINNFLKKNKERAEDLKHSVQKYLDDNPKSLIMASGHDVGILLANYFPERLIFESCDSESLYYYRRFKSLNHRQITKKINSYLWSLIYRKIEKHLSQKAQLYLVPSPADKNWILKLNPQANVVDVGNGTPWLDKPTLDRKIYDNKNPVIAFHGGMTWDPNRVASIYLIKKVFPLIKPQLPSIKLRIAGSPVFQELANLSKTEGVEICGFVDDIQDWLAECNVYVMPMLQGSGVKNKLIEAMAEGLTIVTNSLGAEALPEEAKQSIVIADGEENIANAVVHLLNHPQESLQLGKQARQMAEKYFRWEILSQQFMTEVEKLTQKINV